MEKKNFIQSGYEPDYGVEERINLEGFLLGCEFLRSGGSDVPIAKLTFGFYSAGEKFDVEEIQEELKKFREKTRESSVLLKLKMGFNQLFLKFLKAVSFSFMAIKFHR